MDAKMKIQENPYYIRSLRRPSKELISYALSLDPLSYQFFLRPKNNYKKCLTCCMFHYKRDVNRGCIPIKSSFKLPNFCSSVPNYRKDKSWIIGDYSHLEIAKMFYSDDIDFILQYARKNIRVLEQLDEELANELEEYLYLERNSKPTFLSRLLLILTDFINHAYSINEHDI